MEVGRRQASKCDELVVAVEGAPGASVRDKVGFWAEGVRIAAAVAAAAERRAAEQQRAAKKQHADHLATQVAAAAAAADSALRDQQNGVHAQWAARAIQSIAKEQARESRGHRARWVGAEAKVEAVSRSLWRPT